jgi:hypothetical protein
MINIQPRSKNEMRRARLWYVSGLGFDEEVRASISILVHSRLLLCGASAHFPDENKIVMPPARGE